MRTLILLCIMMILQFSAAIGQGTEPNGSGTSQDPYRISNKQNLLWLSENFNADMSAHYKQTADITFDDADFQSGGDFYNNGELFYPIGWGGFGFTGTYDGHGYVVKNVRIDDEWSSGAGFFSKVGNDPFYGDIESGSVQNLGLVNIDINVSSDPTGGMVGNMVNGTVENCFVLGNVTGADYYVGGFVGQLQSGGVIEQCFYEGNVKGDEEQIGGFVGFNGSINASGGNIRNCYNIGNVTYTLNKDKIGGFCGENKGTIEKSYTTADVVYENGNDPSDKGFIGVNSSSASAKDNFFDSDESNQSSATGATGKSTANMKIQATFTNAGWDFTNTWAIDDGSKSKALINDGYPYLLDDSGDPLPVNLLSFTGERQTESKVELNWSTASEQNNDRFEIQRSDEGEDFTSIGKRKGAGNSNEVLKYQYTDNNAPEGTVYYRLKQVDYNGAYEYSEIVVIRDKDKQQEGSLSVYPNPVPGKFNLQLPEYEGTMQVEVYNMTGQQVYKKEIKERQSLIIQSSAWPEGVYMTICRTPYNVLEKRIIKQ